MSFEKEQAVKIVYSLKAGKKFGKQLKKIDYKDQKRIKQKMEELRNNPRPDGVIRLKEYTDFYRIRIGKYRVIYEIIDSELVILALKVCKREDAYNNLESI